MNPVKAFILALAIAVAVLTFAATTTPPRCEEDQPCWNCYTMGNHHCGN